VSRTTASTEALGALLADDDRPVRERQRLVRLMEIIVDLPAPPDCPRLFPRYHELRSAFLDARDGADGELLEERFLELYAHLHMHEAPYTRPERRRVDATGGYWAHAGGLSPILRAGDWITPGTRSVDLGAGNGLQGLLFQRLYPHRNICQIEISAGMVEIGRRLQQWLSIPDARVEWRCDDVTETQLGGWDFVYLYRPVRPDGPGGAFYERLAERLTAERHEVVIFSIADCLRDVLPPVFECVFTDGHLTCFRKASISQR
jgi:hypothetical protein